MLYGASIYVMNLKDKGKISKFTSASQSCPGCFFMDKKTDAGK
jgi:hypothetical protein